MMSEQEFERKEKLKKLELKIWDRKERIAKWVAFGIIAGMVAITIIITFLANL